MNSLDAIMICMLVALGISIIYMLLVQCCLPRFMNTAAVVLGILVMVAVLILVALYDTLWVKSKWFIFAVFLIFVLVTVLTVIKFRHNMQIQAMFLE